MRSRLLSIGSFVCLAAGLSAPAGASVIFSYVTDASSYNATPGSIVPVNIYLQETLTGTSTSYISANGGVTGAGAGFNVQGTTGGSAAQIPTGSFTFSPSFGGPNAAYYNQGSGSNLEFSEGIAAPPAPTVMPDASGRIFLGKVNITAGSGKTSYILTSLNNDTINNSNSALGQSNGNTTTQNPPPFGSDLDVSPANGAYTGANASPGDVITVGGTSTVPEPASLAVFGVGAMGLLARRRRSA